MTEVQPRHLLTGDQWHFTVTCPIFDSWRRIGSEDSSKFNLESGLREVVGKYGGTVIFNGIHPDVEDEIGWECDECEELIHTNGFVSDEHLDWCSGHPDNESH